ncbi:GIY-YIG nuclease family protein [Sulfitobacter sp. F26204]|uniref:GIY-YIG nuclease family protein n=1 Tax=Sulfitobacter sp. F26204 TaxID=2996014 RepID=UPI00225E5814|nr:GIY-YIG nuclease family protein [Sulfitobacter sp. F26204]MCX7560228.1 GIY-YIG nuclease family protein [Sulfitobacter sp. F26204]
MSNFANTLTISGSPVPIYPGKLMPHWIEAARDKGYDIVARIIDRFHLALRCQHCGELIKVRLFTLMSAQPLCSVCVQKKWVLTAQAAGLIFLKRCPDNRHYAFYEAACGHKIRRQFEFAERVAAGKTDLRCDICHKETEMREAAARGWELIGPDPESDPNYRHYRHSDCGHEQRIARANLQTGRISCGACGEQWPAAPSYLYAIQFTLPNSRELVKLGYSNNPESRLYHQLLRDTDMPCEVLRKVSVNSGQLAIRLEKRLHKKLRESFPDAVVPHAVFADQIKVKSEIYDIAMTPVILAELDALAEPTSVSVS